uniref:Feline leukemia virus subgroup C receptor-related protein 1-like n=1 Tax=Diabrotica virgifera virgifera TaxID=50390 RepID=A0A6P7FTG4_DIAVI
MIGIQNEESTITHVLRIGKVSDRARPVKVICDSNTVKLALKSRNKLRGSRYKMSGDQTKMEQKAHKAAKKSLLERENAGEENLSIQFRHVYYQNVGGLRTRLSDLLINVSCCPYDIIILVESNLNDNFRDSELGCDGFDVFRCDRSLKSSDKLNGGGSLRVTAIVSSVLTVAGSAVKILGNDPSRFYALIIGQGLCAFGQVYIFNIPTKFASAWFGPDEVSTACALAVLGTQLGAAVGAIIPPFMVVKGETKDEIGDGIFNMTLYNTIGAAVILILIILFFRARPKLPPSQSQLQLLTLDEEKTNFWKDCKLLMKDKNYILLLMSFGIINGLWNAFGIVINTFYIKYFPVSIVVFISETLY